MTLLIFVQCEDGGILAADRKATADSGLSLEEMKCQFYPNGWAVAGAGNNGSAIQKLFTDLRNGVTVEHVEERVADKLTEYMQIMKSMKLEIECIVLVSRSGTVEAYGVRTSELGAYPWLITAPYYCVGELGPRIIAEHYIKRRMKESAFTRRQCIDVAPEILAILKLACEEGSFVGEQPNYGLDIILFRQNGCYWARSLRDESAILKTDYVQLSGVSSRLVFQQFDAGAEA